MRRVLKWVGWTLAVLIGLPILLVVIVLILANTGPGQRLIERQTASLTGDTVRMSGLSGRFPDALHVGRLELADAKGVYLTLEGVVLDWAPTRLISGEVRVDELSADHADFARLPVSEPSSTTSSSSSSSYSLPVRVVVETLKIPRFDVGKPVAGEAATLSVAGSAKLDSLETGQAKLDVTRLDSPGHYTLDGAVDPAHIRAALTVDEPPHGLIAEMAGLPDLGAIAADARLDGPRDAVGTKLTLSAGELHATANGTVDLVHEAADLNIAANAPAMSPRPDVSWQSVHVDARVHGPFTKPDANGTVRIADLKAAGAAIQALNADVTGNAGQVALKARAEGLVVPGPKPDLLAGGPLTLDATARLDAPDRPVIFTLHHELLDTTGSAKTAGPLQAHVVLKAPDLAPLAAAGGVDLQGHTNLTVDAAQQGDTTSVTLNGTLGVTGGMAPVPALIGPDAKIDLAASMTGQDIRVTRLAVNGKTLDVTAQGALADKKLDADWTVALSDLGAVQPSLEGQLEAKGHAAGPMDDLAVQADLTGQVSGQGYKSGALTAHVDASGLPGAPKAQVTAQGTLLDSPLDVALAASRQPDGQMHLTIDRLSWKTAQAQGALALAPNATLPTGKLTFRMKRLADLAPLLGRQIAGSVEAALDADDQAAKLDVTAQNVAIPGTAAVDRLAVAATVTDPTGTPKVDGTLTADGVNASGYAGNARVTARGPTTALALTVAANASDLMGSPAKLDTSGTLDIPDKTLALAALRAAWKQETLKLLAPVRIGFADGVSLDRLRLGLRQAVIEVDGHAGSTLDLTASIRNLPADIAAVVAPDYAADGTLGLDARLRGTTAEPQGTVHLTARGLHLRNGPGQALPPANLTADATLHGTSAQVDTRLNAGSSHLTLNGTAPLSTTGPMNLRSAGLIDLALLDPLLAADGRQVRGRLTLDATIAGTAAAPKVNGTARLANGEVQDTPLGVHLTAMTALIEANGDTIRLTSLTARAGPGTMRANGTVGLGGAMPVDIRVTADNARPLSSDLMTAFIDLDLRLQGEVQGALSASGRVHVRRAEIRVPEKLPASVAVIPTRVAGQPLPKPKPPAKPLDLALDILLDAPNQIFIRGRGIDVELGGRIRIRGTAANPQPDGGLNLIRGTFSVVGQTLTFTQGSITFTGAGITDPAINLVAQNVTSALTATLTISGSARDPKITLSSTPDMPQDEILAQLLFNTSTSKLSAFQIAEIAAALAQLSGATGGVGDPLGSIRGALGLDRLSIGSSSNGNPALEAGSYVAPGVYVGAKQSASGTGTQATVQIDLAKG
ncbi:MAG: translocation/assembly module TamB domain-containing protein, partial [Rhodospirillales bacterium]|nr:translocation/assembly module TamB domain-containing protein [Rhodospirillales bacterium]